jgi:hypothetical protein
MYKLKPYIEKVERKSNVPILLENFKEIHNAPLISPAQLEKFPAHIFTQEREWLHSFEEAKKSFFFVYDRDKVLDYMQKEPSEEGFRYLKNIRRLGLILRSHYIFIDEKHKAPEYPKEFFTKLGEFNDNYWRQGKSRKLLANEIGKITKKISPDKLTLEPDSYYGFMQNFRDILNESRSYLQSSKLSITKYHQLRKRLRAIADLMQVTVAESIGSELHWLCASILNITDILGQNIDAAKEKSKEEKIDEDSYMIKVDPVLSDKFKILLPYINKFAGIPAKPREVIKQRVLQ